MIAELAGECSPFTLEYVRDHHVGALGDEAARVTGTHATGSARDNHGPIIETIHDCFPFITITPIHPASVSINGLPERGAYGSPRCALERRATRRVLCGPSGSRGRERACAERPSRERI